MRQRRCLICTTIVIVIVIIYIDATWLQIMYLSSVTYIICRTITANAICGILVVIIFVANTINSRVLFLILQEMIQCSLPGTDEHSMHAVQHGETSTETGTGNREGDSANLILHTSPVNDK